MSVPPELMKMMAGGPKPGAAPAGAPGANQPPAGGPMSTPQPKEGLDQAAMINMSIAIKMLEQVQGKFGSLTSKGQAAHKALGILIKEFGQEAQKADSLIPAELQQLMQTVPGAGGGPPAAKAMGAMPPGAPAVPAAA